MKAFDVVFEIKGILRSMELEELKNYFSVFEECNTFGSLDLHESYMKSKDVELAKYSKTARSSNI